MLLKEWAVGHQWSQRTRPQAREASSPVEALHLVGAAQHVAAFFCHLLQGAPAIIQLLHKTGVQTRRSRPHDSIKDQRSKHEKVSHVSQTDRRTRAGL